MPLPRKDYTTTISANEIDERDRNNKKRGRAEGAIAAVLAAALIKKRKRVISLLKSHGK